jgi:hypothetical protein
MKSFLSSLFSPFTFTLSFFLANLLLLGVYYYKPHLVLGSEGNKDLGEKNHDLLHLAKHLTKFFLVS